MRTVGISNEQAWQAWDSLLDAGVSPRQISQTIGMTETTVAQMGQRRRAGETPVLRHSTRKAIVAMSQNPPPSMWVPSCGPARRLQALSARGWSMAEVAKHVDVPTSTLHALRSQITSKTKRALAEQIRDVYDLLWDKQPTGNVRAIGRSRNTAQARGWALPAMWDDEALDDPDARAWNVRDYWADCGQCDGTGRVRGAEHRTCRACKGEGIREVKPIRANAIDIEDVQMLASGGSNWDDLAARLNVDADSVYRMLWRRGERELLRQISANSVQTGEDIKAVRAYAG
jgi:lambda repressor-like predicted transcriptional regulator/transposase-like protein